MNSNWRNRPTTIDYIPTGIDWVVSIDESGMANLKKVADCRQQGISPPDSEQHFTVTACLMKTSDLEFNRDKVMQIKNRYWADALYDYNGQMKRVCFHSREIRGRKGPFSPAVIDYENFILDLSQMMEDARYILFAANIDKFAHFDRYHSPIPPYSLCMDFVLERIVRQISDTSSCVVVLEGRGKKEDKIILEHIRELIDHGNSYVSSSVFQKIKGVFFNGKWSKEFNEKKSYWALELADLCAYPIHKCCAYHTQDKSFHILMPKFFNYPNILGFGLKKFP